MSSAAVVTPSVSDKKRAAPSGGAAAILAARRKKSTASVAATSAVVEPQQQASEVRPPATESAASFESRLASAVRSTNCTFYPSTEVAARYAHAPPVREFLSTEGVEASAIVSSMGQAAQVHTETLSRIDALITEQQNGEAAARINYGRQVIASASGLDPRTPAGALEYGRADGRALSIDEFAARVLGIDSIDSVGDDLLREPYQVNGLSVEEDNPDYLALQEDRAQLELRREQLQFERQQLIDLRSARGVASAAEEARIREQLREQLMLYAPIESVQLLKPASQVRELNERWRNLLGSALARIASDYQSGTAAGLQAAPGASADALQLYMERVRNPVLNRYVAELRQATFEDMPLTREQLESYFNRFVGVVVTAMAADERRLGEQALAEAREEQISAADRYFAFGLAAAAAEQPIEGFVPEDLTPVPSAASGTTPADEERLVKAYWRDTLYVYATEDYVRWLDRWLADFQQRQPGLLSQTGADTLRESVRKLIDGRARMYRERIAQLGRALPPYVPPSEAEMVRAYTALVTADVALMRARTLVDQEEESALRTQIQSALRGRIQVLPLEVLLAPRVDRFEILEQERALLERSLRDSFVAPGPGADERAAAFQQRALDTSLGELALRKTVVERALLAYAPRVGAGVGSRGPDDSEGGVSYDLSYPLDLIKTQRQLGALEARVSRQAQRFDGDAMHERANSLRSVLSYSYAERLLQREILRINFALKHHMLPTRVAPLVLALQATDTRRPLVLTASIGLRDELELALRAPDELLRDARIDEVQRALSTASFEVTWFFRPKEERADGSIAEAPVGASETLAAGVRTARLLRYGDKSMAELAGTYRVEFRLLNGDGNRAALYKSRFQATVRVFARSRRCARDYEVGSEAFGDCEWCETARDDATTDFATDLALLVTRGQQAVDEARERRANDRRSVLAASQFETPWGGESERAIETALARFDVEDFRYPKLFAHLVRRIGGRVREALAAADGGFGSLISYASDLKLLALLVDRSTVEKEAQLVALRGSASGTWSDARVGDSSFSFDGASVPASIFEPLHKFETLPNEEIELLAVATAPADVTQVPLASMLLACLTPPLWQILSATERRFVHDLVRRFERFGFEQRERYYQTVREDLIVRNGNFLPVVVEAPLLRASVYAYGTGLRLMQRDSPLVSLGDTELGMRVDRQLADMLPASVASRARNWLSFGRGDTDNDYEDMLLDRELLADFQERVRRLQRNGLASIDENDCERRQTWLGTDSFTTDQPDRYEIEIGERGARILKRGSQPLNKGYDFGGIHALLQNAVDEYNTAANDTRIVAAARARALARIGDRVRDLELVFHFLAFVAPPRDAEWYLPATDMLAAMSSRADIIAFLARLAPARIH